MSMCIVREAYSNNDMYIIMRIGLWIVVVQFIYTSLCENWLNVGERPHCADGRMQGTLIYSEHDKFVNIFPE